MNPDSPLTPAFVAPPAPTPRWRWWVSWLLIASLPILASVSGLRRAQAQQARNDAGGIFPTSVLGLLWFCALQLGVFALLWGVAWAFSRANSDQLFLRFRGVKSLLWGVGYSLLMRFGLGFLAMLVLIFLALLGFNLEAMTDTIKANAQTIKEAFGPAMAARDPLYRLLLVTLVSFVVAGLREELWRVATMAGIFHLAPQKWSQKRVNGVALGVSSLLFGVGHLYQGATGVIGTTLLGVVLGAITLKHRSVWPAVVAHGCFDAASFAALGVLGAR